MDKFTDIEIFEILKKSIVNRFFEENSAQSENISDWRGQEIISFQEDLFSKTKSTVSEKWFYTYFKSDFKKLPRIDMLNLLSQYCGYRNWAHFQKTKNTEYFKKQSKEKRVNQVIGNIAPQIKIPKEKSEDNNNNKLDLIQIKSKTKKFKLIYITISVFIFIIGFVISFYLLFVVKKEYEFCFMDSDRRMPIKNTVEVTILRDGFTPLYLSTKTGCIKFKSQKDVVKMFVSSAYYKQDTFKVNLNQYNQPEKLLLNPDDYKTMLYYYSNSAKDLKQRVSKLSQMIADNALIYKVYDNDFFGVEILTKQQYINLVTIPTTSLKNFVLIESETKNGKIIKLKFKIQQDDNEK